MLTLPHLVRNMVPLVSEPPPTPAPPTLEVVKTPIKPAGMMDNNTTLRPETPRRATAPESLNATSPFSKPSTITYPMRPRNRSPFSGHVRSRSSASSLSAPPMSRAHSSPVPDSAGRLLMSTIARPSSPLGPPGRHRSPLRRVSDEPYSSYGGQIDIGETISENSELDLTPRGTSDVDAVPTSPLPYLQNTFPRSGRRPSSPLHQGTPSPFLNSTPTSILRTSISSPSLAAARYNESYPSNSSFSSSSIPSTPTSFRSRSPSISSLETIPDSPDAELEAENIARLKAAADRESNCEGEDGVRRRASSDVLGKGGATRDKRKRWSVCGAERRGDLDLETIWED